MYCINIHVRDLDCLYAKAIYETLDYSPNIFDRQYGINIAYHTILLYVLWGYNDYIQHNLTNLGDVL